MTKTSSTSSYAATHAKQFTAVAARYLETLSREEPTADEIEEQWELLAYLPGSQFPVRASKEKARRKSSASSKRRRLNSQNSDGSEIGTESDMDDEDLAEDAEDEKQRASDKKLLRIMLNIAFMRFCGVLRVLHVT